MKALSVRQPWAWLIIHGGKTYENRSWGTQFRGRFLVHASSKIDKMAYKMLSEAGVKMPPLNELRTGGVIGSVFLEDVHDIQTADQNNNWFQGPRAFLLSNPTALPFYRCSGALNFFDLQYEREEQPQEAETDSGPLMTGACR